jgi:hypothetical protein
LSNPRLVVMRAGYGRRSWAPVGELPRMAVATNVLVMVAMR